MSRPAATPTATADERLSLRLPAELADALDDAYLTKSAGIRAAIKYLLAEAPLEAWTRPQAGSGDFVGRRTVRTTVRLPDEQLQALEAVVQQHPVADRSRAVRDGVREVLRT
jgi:Arc/MetJ-type ribon-helix-helix transcriptional regulator